MPHLNFNILFTNHLHNLFAALHAIRGKSPQLILRMLNFLTCGRFLTGKAGDVVLDAASGCLDFTAFSNFSSGETLSSVSDIIPASCHYI